FGDPFYTDSQIKGLQRLQKLLRGESQRTEKNIAPIPLFNGRTDPITWLEKYEDAAILNCLTNQRKLEILTSALIGIAGKWYRSIRNDITTWEHNPAHIVDKSFKTAFMKRFCHEERQEEYEIALRK